MYIIYMYILYICMYMYNYFMHSDFSSRYFLRDIY